MYVLSGTVCSTKVIFVFDGVSSIIYKRNKNIYLNVVAKTVFVETRMNHF